jgi:hypothetical protein
LNSPIGLAEEYAWQGFAPLVISTPNNLFKEITPWTVPERIRGTMDKCG